MILQVRRAAGIPDVAVENIKAKEMAGVEVIMKICSHLLDGACKPCQLIVGIVYYNHCIKGMEMCRIEGAYNGVKL